VIFPSFEPPPDRGVVGVGHPISVIFDKAPPDQAAAERAVTVTTVPAQVGGWYWVDERTMHYRPQAYWQAGTQVTDAGLSHLTGLKLESILIGPRITDKGLRSVVQIKSLKQVGEMVKRNGASFFDTLEEVTSYLNNQ